MNRIPCSIASGLLVASVLVGCSTSGAGPQPEQTTAAARTGSSPVATYPETGVGFDAAIEGTLQLVDDCVVVGSPGAYVVPVFPEESDASWNDGVLTWNGDEYRAGDKVSFGGGGTASEDSYIPTGCTGLDTILIGA